MPKLFLDASHQGTINHPLDSAWLWSSQSWRHPCNPRHRFPPRMSKIRDLHIRSVVAHYHWIEFHHLLEEIASHYSSFRRLHRDCYSWWWHSNFRHCDFRDVSSSRKPWWWRYWQYQSSNCYVVLWQYHWSPHSWYTLICYSYCCTDSCHQWFFEHHEISDLWVEMHNQPKIG